MSADKGGALVRSPPGLVDTYSNHVGTNASWGDQSAPHITSLKQQQHSKRNATVTKLFSGGYKGAARNGGTKSVLTTDDKPDSFKSLKEEDDAKECSCGSWVKARQLEYDLEQLQKTHDEILKGLHCQLDEMKQKNRDLTFQLLMGPYANSIQVDAPLSPESDITPPKEGAREVHFHSVSEYKESPISRIQETTTPSKESSHELISEPEKYVINQRDRTGRPGDPRLARSLDMELLEEESDALRKQLLEERAKNKYLLNLAEDLKRQIRDETGAWCPPPPGSKMVGHRTSKKSGHDNWSQYSNGLGTRQNSVRLPQLYYNEQRLQSSHEQITRNDMHHTDVKDSNIIRKATTPLSLERGKEFGAAKPLPAIISSAEPYSKTAEPANHSQQIDPSKPDKYLHDRSHMKSKAQLSSSHSNSLHGDAGQISSHVSYEQQNHGQYKAHEENYHQSNFVLKNRDIQNQGDNTHPAGQSFGKDGKEREKRKHRQHRENLQINKSTKPQSPDFPSSENGQSSTKSKNSSRRKDSKEEKDFPIHKVNHSRSNSKSKKHSLREKDTESSSFQNKVKENEKVDFHQREGKSVINSTKSSKSRGRPSETVLASPSTSVGSMASSTSNRNKHRGKIGKRGGKKNKKDSIEVKEDLK